MFDSELANQKPHNKTSSCLSGFQALTLSIWRGPMFDDPSTVGPQSAEAGVRSTDYE